MILKLSKFPKKMSMPESVKIYIARIETDSGTITFEFESSEKTVKCLMESALEIAHDCIDDAAVFIEPKN